MYIPALGLLRGRGRLLVFNVVRESGIVKGKPTNLLEINQKEEAITENLSQLTDRSNWR
ncbi:MAG: hypothetical protein LDL41_01820 [Coleofasciculus sp. S288]|nr:hypothetical protein [Coleofasciculus sp. S288]